LFDLLTEASVYEEGINGRYLRLSK